MFKLRKKGEVYDGRLRLIPSLQLGLAGKEQPLNDNMKEKVGRVIPTFDWILIFVQAVS